MNATDPAARPTAPPEAPPTVHLWVEEPGRPPRRVILPAGVPARLGRSFVAELPLADREVSRLHAVLRFNGRALTVADHQSRNGTYLQGARVWDAVEVSPGEAIQVGDTLVVRACASPPRAGGAAADGEDRAAPVAVDPAMADVVAQARRLAVMSVPIWIDGERGSGKSVLAQVVHRESRRAWQPFIRVPCANLAPRDVDRALLGFRYEVAGGAARAVGLVERADGGTLFLEGVDALPAAGHALLLRALDERAITPVGDTRRLHVDVRVVASSGGRDVGPRVGPSGRLYERLRGAVLAVPPLRERPLDVASLAERFLALAGDGRALGPGVAHALRAHRWPGNVRELRDAMGFARALASGDAIGLDDLPRAVREPADPQDGDDPLVRDAQREACERSAVMLALAAAGDVAGAARVLEVSRGALRASIERLGLGPRELGVPD